MINIMLCCSLGNGFGFGVSVYIKLKDFFPWLMFHICSVTITCSMFLNGKSNIDFSFKILITIVK